MNYTSIMTSSERVVVKCHPAEYDNQPINNQLLLAESCFKLSKYFVIFAGLGFCLACSVLFRISAYTGAKQASSLPTGSKQDNSPHNDDVKDVSVLLVSELIGSV